MIIFHALLSVSVVKQNLPGFALVFKFVKHQVRHKFRNDALAEFGMYFVPAFLRRPHALRRIFLEIPELVIKFVFFGIKSGFIFLK